MHGPIMLSNEEPLAIVLLDPGCLQRDPMSTVTITSSHVVGWSI